MQWRHFLSFPAMRALSPALESAHAVAFAMRYAREHRQGAILANLSGRGDKDIDYVIEHYGTGENYL